MVPINQVKPKALLEIDGKPIIERLIQQLFNVNITDITIVVGYMKEAFDYLIDKYAVKLVFNKEYLKKKHAVFLKKYGVFFVKKPEMLK